MSILKGLLACALFACASLPVLAQDAGESTIKVEDLKEKNVTPGGDVDELITNNKMRAEIGSKSRWSLSTDFSYNGATVKNPFAEDRPNIAGGTGTTDKAALSGSVSTKFNVNKQHSLSAGVGMRWIAPLAGSQLSNYNGDRFDTDNPYLTYQYVYKWMGIQSALTAGPTIYTNSNLTNLGFVGNFMVAQNNIYEVGRTGLSLGMYLGAMVSAFNKSGPLGDPADEENYIADVRTQQSDYSISVAPFVEYQLTDKINLRTVSNIANLEHIRAEGRPTTFLWTKVYQSVGVGISVTRDIFLYPNIQFLPDNIRADRTNVALNTNINMF